MRSPFRGCSSVRLPLAVALLATLCLSGEPSTAWRQSELIEPSALASALKSNNPPFVLCVSEVSAYDARHIANAIFAGPGGKADGIDLLKAAASALPKDDNIVIYCSCCPLNKCPNVRPAYTVLKELGFTHVRVFDLMTNMQKEWYDLGYPSEGSAK